MIQLLKSFTANGLRSFSIDPACVNPKKQTFFIFISDKKQPIFPCITAKQPHISPT